MFISNTLSLGSAKSANIEALKVRIGKSLIVFCRRLAIIGQQVALFLKTTASASRIFQKKLNEGDHLG